MRDVFIVGVGQTPVNRDGKVRGRHLAATAIDLAVRDAVLDRADIDALFVGNMTAGALGQQQQLGGLIADYSGLSGIDAISIEAACASGGAAARMGFLTVAGGIHDIALICGTERMTHADTDSVTRALATAADWELEGSRGESFLSLNAQLMIQYFEKFSTDHDDFSQFSIIAHDNALTNSHALFHKRVDLEAYQTSRVVVDPLQLYDVSPICNGSAAILLAAGDAAQRLNRNRPKIRVLGSSAATAPLAMSRRKDPLHLSAVESSTLKILSEAGITHADIDLFELHDAYTIMSALSLEAAGFAKPGAGTSLASEGRISLTGDIPISTMGGLKARGHPIGATGIYQLIEAYMQLAGTAGPNQIPNAEIALTQNIGGIGSTVVNHLLQRVA